MAYEDYSFSEISSICSELISTHSDKLKDEEVAFVTRLYRINSVKRIDNKDRDTLIGMYDRLRGEE